MVLQLMLTLALGLSSLPVPGRPGRSGTGPVPQPLQPGAGARAALQTAASTSSEQSRPGQRSANGLETRRKPRDEPWLGVLMASPFHRRMPYFMPCKRIGAGAAFLCI